MELMTRQIFYKACGIILQQNRNIKVNIIGQVIQMTGFGVCTDVIAFGLRGAGYDLMELVNADIKANKKMYQLDVVDKNIDFRRVNNLRIFFERNAKSLTTDLTDIKEWQGGDIIVFKTHIGVVSDKRNWRGIPFIIHNGGLHFEEDILEYRTDIVGHFRMS